MRNKRPRKHLLAHKRSATALEIALLARTKANAEHWMQRFDDFPAELRSAINRYRCSIAQVSDLLACGVPVSTIIAALEAENRRSK